MKVWLITCGEPTPDDSSDVRLYRTGMLANYLRDNGVEVTWWTSDFSHTLKRHRLGSTKVTECKNIKIVYLHGCGYVGHVSIRRIIDHVQVGLEFKREAKGHSKPDVIVAAYPTLELCYFAGKYARSQGIPMIVDVRDLWPDIFTEALPKTTRAIGGIAMIPYKKFGKCALAMAKSIVSITPECLQWAQRRVGKNRKARSMDKVIPFTYRMPNLNYERGAYNPEDLLKKYFPKRINGDNKKIFVASFFGVFSRQFDFMTIIEAAKALEATYPGQYLFILCGSGDQLDLVKHKASGLRNVCFTGWVNTYEIIDISRLSNVGLAPYRCSYSFLKSVPNKAIEYMALGMPIVTCLRGSLENLILRNGIGFIYQEGDSEGLSGLLCKINNEGTIGSLKYSDNCRALYASSYEESAVMGSYFDHIKKVIGDN